MGHKELVGLKAPLVPLSCLIEEKGNRKKNEAYTRRNLILLVKLYEIVIIW